MVEGVLSLDNLLVTAIMTPRSKIVFLNIDDNEETNWRKIVTSGHSYFPVFQRNRDHVVGMVSVKALWAHSAIGLPTTLKNLLVPPLIAPEAMTATQLLEQFKKTGRHTAVISDEFGAVQGLVTLIDVFEAIVGDLPEPGRRNQSGAKRREDGSWEVDATLPIAEFKSLLGVAAPLPDESEAEYRTAGGSPSRSLDAYRPWETISTGRVGASRSWRWTAAGSTSCWPRESRTRGRAGGVNTPPCE